MRYHEDLGLALTARHHGVDVVQLERAAVLRLGVGYHLGGGRHQEAEAVGPGRGRGGGVAEEGLREDAGLLGEDLDLEADQLELDPVLKIIE